MILAVLSMFISVSSHAEDSLEFMYSGSVDQEGSYQVQILETFPKEISLEDIFQKGFLNADLQKSLSPMLKDVQYDSSIPEILSSKAPVSHFSLISFIDLYVLRKALISRCTIEQKNDQIISSCSVDLKKGFAHHLFHFGKSHLKCSGAPDEIKTCSLFFEGRPKSIEVPFIYKRTAARLAVSGITNLVSGMYKTRYVLMNQHSSPVNAEKDVFYQNKIQAFWQSMMSQFRDDQDLEKDLSFSSIAASTDSLIQVGSK